jgi:hypothetical protein
MSHNRPPRNRPRTPQFHLSNDDADARTAVVRVFRAEKRDGGHLWGVLTAAHPEVADRVGYIRQFWGREGQPHFRVTGIVWDEPGNSPERTLDAVTRPALRPNDDYELIETPEMFNPNLETGRYNVELILAATTAQGFPEEVELDLD